MSATRKQFMVEQAMNQLSMLQMQCLAVSQTIDGILKTLTTELDDEPAIAPKVCPHPKEQRLNTAVMGHPSRFICRLCHVEVDPDAQTVSERGSVIVACRG